MLGCQIRELKFRTRAWVNDIVDRHLPLGKM